MDNNIKEKQLERKQAILRAAEKVIAVKGYNLATVDDIAAEAGLSKGSIYNYFQSKEDVFTQLFLQAVEEDQLKTAELVARDMPADEKLSTLLDEWYERFEHYKQYGRLLLEFWVTAAGDPEGTFAQTLQELYQRYRRQVSSIFEQGRDEGRFELVSEPHVAASIFMAMIDGIGLQTLLGVRASFEAESRDAIRIGLLKALQPTNTNTP
jgi:AcrR family transcriptional regulator